jgi:predicted PurR-regulated permease PerM
MENKGISRGFASLISLVSLVAIIAAIILLLVWQFYNVAANIGDLEKSITPFIQKIRTSLDTQFGFTQEKQQQLMQQQQQGGGGEGTSMVKKFLSGLSGFIVDTILVLVYTFLFLYFRTHLKTFILKLVPQQEEPTATKIMYDASKVSRKYVTGMGIMIVILWVMYGIGFSIAGVKNPIFFAILCGVLEIVPFVGNITGTAFTLVVSLSQGGGSNLIIGILITYALVQFIQTYLLEPLVVGSAENLNPLFTIIVLVIGELVWGIAGLVLALPLFGIVKVIFDNVEPLKPYGFLTGKEDKDEGGVVEKIKGLFKRG